MGNCENYAKMHLERHYGESFLKILISRATLDDFEAVSFEWGPGIHIFKKQPR